jgi:hypothetical protein
MNSRKTSDSLTGRSIPTWKSPIWPCSAPRPESTRNHLRRSIRPPDRSLEGRLRSKGRNLLVQDGSTDPKQIYALVFGIYPFSFILKQSDLIGQMIEFVGRLPSEWEEKAQDLMKDSKRAFPCESRTYHTNWCRARAD